ncbi:MAG: hypothetical protein EOP04_02805 [Proteobacteria bacterium]|nr:MAG: hypothetical protein EOP04_02805 [Pseudomonadota bacterium]
MNSRLIVFIFSCLASLSINSACATVTFTEQQPTKWIPFELKDNFMIFKAEIRGLPASATIDTGQTFTHISSKIAQTSRLPDGYAFVLRCADKTVEVGAVGRVNYAVDGRSLKLRTMIDRGGEMIADVDIMFGADILKGGGIEIDYTKRQLRFFGEDFRYKGASSPLKLEKSVLGVPVLQGTIDGEKRTIVIDTGNVSPTVALFVDKERFDRIAPTFEADGVTFKTAKSCGGTRIPVKVKKDSVISIGGLLKSKLDSSYAASPEITKVVPDLTSLGFEFLKRFHVTLDLGKNELYLD